eukprot:TRINITY_DN4932_c0_g1_i1.p2 TRINITY_DN4932_c0_g1~~TRINITY_DN4932_c0_g1_i1.p2  ORF type:complete len:104 (+),score=14.13 TRINITY_DN4932_c0_g1_i1:344-655(+)
MNMHFNGYDTVVFNYPGVGGDGPQGLIIFYTKFNGQWSYNTITAAELSFEDGFSALGLRSIATINQNSMIFGAGKEGNAFLKRGASVQPSFGKGVIVQRQNGT